MNRRTVIAIVAGSVVLVAVGTIAWWVVAGRSAGRIDDELGDFADREILVPGTDYRLAPVERELATPETYPYVDPERPLDDGVVSRLKPDVVRELRDAYEQRVEDEVEALLFDEPRR